MITVVDGDDEDDDSTGCDNDGGLLLFLSPNSKRKTSE